VEGQGREGKNMAKDHKPTLLPYLETIEMIIVEMVKMTEFKCKLLTNFTTTKNNN
jgi:hypothetical protein